MIDKKLFVALCLLLLLAFLCVFSTSILLGMTIDSLQELEQKVHELEKLIEKVGR